MYQCRGTLAPKQEGTHFFRVSETQKKNELVVRSLIDNFNAKMGGGQIIYLKKGPESQQVPYDQILKLLT